MPDGQSQFFQDLGLPDIGTRTQRLGLKDTIGPRKNAHDNRLLFLMYLKNPPVRIQPVSMPGSMIMSRTITSGL